MHGYASRLVCFKLPQNIVISQFSKSRKMASQSAINSTKAQPHLTPTVDQQENATSRERFKFADVGINLGDPVFQGIYHEKKAHDDDFEDVLQRAVDVGCIKMMVTGSDLNESRKAIRIAETHRGLCYATIGVHPCSAKSFDTYPGGPSALLEELETLALASQQSSPRTASAFGEIGLDYDRLFLCPKDQQLKYFEAQLDLAVKLQFPLFLHSRAASADFERLIRHRLTQLPKKGLVHSFTGTIEEMQRLVEMGFDIGINGCSMKTEENVEVVKAIPLGQLQIETDGPWCEMRASHASAKYLANALPLPKAVKKEKWQRGLMVKGRNEPVTIRQVAYAIAAIKDIPLEEVCEAAWKNSVKMFGLGESIDEKSSDHEDE